MPSTFQSNQTEQPSILKKIWAHIKNAIAWCLTPFERFFRWMQVAKSQNDAAHSQVAEQRAIPLTIEDADLKARLHRDRQRVEALQKYKDNSSKFNKNAEGLMRVLKEAEKQYAIKQLLPKTLEGFESSISQLEKSTQEMIVYQKTHLTILLFQKIKEIKPLIDMFPESDEKQKKRKQTAVKELKDMLAALELDNANVLKLSSSDQEVAYTSEKRDRLINEILIRLKGIPNLVDLEKAYGEIIKDLQAMNMVQQVQQEGMELGAQAIKLQPSSEIEQQSPLPTQPSPVQPPVSVLARSTPELQAVFLSAYKTGVSNRLLGMHRMIAPPPLPFSLDRFKKAVDLYGKESILKMEKLQKANTKEEIDVSANALAAHFMQAGHIDSSRFWQEAAVAEEIPEGAKTIKP